MSRNYEHMNGREDEATSLQFFFVVFENVNQLNVNHEMKALNGERWEETCIADWMDTLVRERAHIT